MKTASTLLALAATFALTACGHGSLLAAPRQATSAAALAFGGGTLVMGAAQTGSSSEFGAEQVFTLALTVNGKSQAWKIDATQSQHTRLDHGFVTFTIDGAAQTFDQKQAAAATLAHAEFGTRSVQLAIVEAAEQALLHGDWSGSPDSN